MVVSQLSEEKLAEYLRLESRQYRPGELEELLSAARAYVRGYTGLDDAKIDAYPDLTIAVKILVQDFYDNRGMYTDKVNATVNKTVDTILGMHRVNLL